MGRAGHAGIGAGNIASQVLDRIDIECDAQDSIRAMSDVATSWSVQARFLTPAQEGQAVTARARFVVSPKLSRAAAERCLERGVLALSGAVTATEIQAALELGLRPPSWSGSRAVRRHVLPGRLRTSPTSR